jgi:hypothetical protein
MMAGVFKKASWDGHGTGEVCVSWVLERIERSHPAQCAKIEAQIFLLLGRHQHLVTFHGLAVAEDGSHSLVTELAPLGPMDEVMEQHANDLRALRGGAKQKLFIKILSQVHDVHCRPAAATEQSYMHTCSSMCLHFLYTQSVR